MKKLTLVLFVILGLAAAIFLVPTAFAHDNDDGPITIVNQTTVNETFINVNNAGVASALASSEIAKDWNTTRPQVGIGVGRFEGNTAFAIGGAYKPCNNCFLFTGSLTRENGVTGAGLGINWRF